MCSQFLPAFALFVQLFACLAHAQSTLSSPIPVASANSPSSDGKLFNKFHKRIYPLLTHPEKGCVDCHSSEGTSNLVLTGSSTEDFHTLLDEQYLKWKGVDTLLNRVANAHGERRMPKDAEPWSDKEILKLKSFLHSVQDAEQLHGVAADEQFPRSLLMPYKGDKPATPENQFITLRQLQGKIRVLFDDDWMRGDRDLFSENLAMFGGADFKTRFNETSQPSATFLIGLEMLARDVTNRAFELRLGPFRDWPKFDAPPVRSTAPSTDPDYLRYRTAIQKLYERVLFRPASESEIVDAHALLCGIFELEETIKKRDSELGFEVTVKDVASGLEQRRTIRIPVNGELLEVKQVLVDQSILSQVESHIYLEPNLTGQRLVVHNIDTVRNVSFAGVEILDETGKRIEMIGADSPSVEVEGAWQIDDEDRFRSYEDRAMHKGMSLIRVPLNVPHAGDYQVVLRWRPSAKNATNVLCELYGKRAGNVLASPRAEPIPPIGEAHFRFDCSSDNQPFASPECSFQFSEGDSVEISNRGTFDTVTAAAVGFVRRDADEPAFLVDSKEADGNNGWKRYDAGRFKAYNVKGTLIYDDNKHKGELSLAYRPSLKKDKGWKEDAFYGLRVYFPGKKDQECEVPLVVRSQQSSPIVHVTFPKIAKAEAKIRMDASSSYTVAHSKLDFEWRQISGTRVAFPDKHSPMLEVIAPRPSVEQVAWTAICSALLRHPDFLFACPPSISAINQPDIKERLRLVKLSLDLVGRPPTRDEIAELDQGTKLSEFAARFLDSQAFRDFYFHRIRLNLESQGTEIQDEPVRLWSYVAFHDRPFTEILTANYTVDRDMNRMDRPAHHGRTGLLTTPGFIQGKPGLPHYNYAAQVSMLFLGFVYEVPAEIVDQREGVTALGTTDPNSVCYSCHKILTPLAFQRLEWSDEGVYRTKDEAGQAIDASDQNASEDYPFPGKGMEAFATQAIKKERFIRTMINTHVHFYFGRPMRHREDERVLYKRLWDSVHQSDFKIRSLIRDIVCSPEYLQ